MKSTSCAALLIVALACDGPKTNESAKLSYDLSLPDEPAQGPTFEDADLRLEAGAPEVCNTGGVLGPAAGKTRLVIPLNIEAKGQREIPLGPMLFSLRIQEQTYRPTLATCKKSFHVGRLYPNASRSEYVAFDLPDIGQPMELRFEPFLIGRKEFLAKVLVPKMSPTEVIDASPETTRDQH